MCFFKFYSRVLNHKIIRSTDVISSFRSKIDYAENDGKIFKPSEVPEYPTTEGQNGNANTGSVNNSPSNRKPLTFSDGCKYHVYSRFVNEVLFYFFDFFFQINLDTEKDLNKFENSIYIGMCNCDYYTA